MVYVDTSVFVAAVLNESHSESARKWLLRQPADSLAISQWTITEFSAALSVKLREGEFDLEQRNHALSMFTRWISNTLNVLEVTATDFHTATRIADQHPTGLRAGDALHLGIAANRGVSLCTLDKRLAKSARLTGTDVVVPG